MEAIQDGSLNTGAKHYKKVMCCLRRHMVGPDLHAWQLLLASVNEMSTELKVLANSGASTTTDAIAAAKVLSMPSRHFLHATTSPP